MNEDELQRIVDAVNGVPLREPGWYTAREIAQRAGRSTDPTRRKLQQMARRGEIEMKVVYDAELGLDVLVFRMGDRTDGG